LFRFHIRSKQAKSNEPSQGISKTSQGISKRGRIYVSDGQNVTASVSESESPAIPSPRPKRVRPRTNNDWWPDQLDLSLLHKHSPLSNPMGGSFSYAEEFRTLDVEALKRDLIQVMRTSQDWWPADYGHYGPFSIRMTWHAAGASRRTSGVCVVVDPIAITMGSLNSMQIW
jgi:hypothetical protein